MRYPLAGPSQPRRRPEGQVRGQVSECKGIRLLELGFLTSGHCWASPAPSPSGEQAAGSGRGLQVVSALPGPDTQWFPPPCPGPGAGAFRGRACVPQAGWVPTQSPGCAHSTRACGIWAWPGHLGVRSCALEPAPRVKTDHRLPCSRGRHPG